MSNGDLALPLYEKSLARRRRVLGNTDPHTLTSINNMALLRGDMGEYEAAATLMREALAGRRRVLGEDHPFTQSSLEGMLRLEKSWQWRLRRLRRRGRRRKRRRRRCTSG